MVGKSAKNKLQKRIPKETSGFIFFPGLHPEKKNWADTISLKKKSRFAEPEKKIPGFEIDLDFSRP